MLFGKDCSRNPKPQPVLTHTALKPASSLPLSCFSITNVAAKKPVHRIRFLHVFFYFYSSHYLWSSACLSYSKAPSNSFLPYGIRRICIALARFLCASTIKRSLAICSIDLLTPSLYLFAIPTAKPFVNEAWLLLVQHIFQSYVPGLRECI